jgi:quercetin dioxygenase-like cupin family protein
MPLNRFDALDFIETPGGNASAPLATASMGACEVSVIRQRQMPGGNNPPHTHNREEVLVLLAGSLEVTLGPTAHTLRRGDTLVIPAGEAHQLRTSGEEPAEWLLVAPAGYRFYHASGEEATPAWSR